MKLLPKVIVGTGLSVAIILSLASLAQAAPDSSKVLAIVNGEAITEEALTIYANQKNTPQGAPQHNDGLLEELINMVVLSQDAERQSLTKESRNREILSLQRNSFLASVAVQSHMDNNPVTDGELKATYESRSASAKPGQEYKASHILSKTEADAINVIKELDKGVNFAELARKVSTGPSGKTGGSLGWFGLEQMVKPFSDATAGLAKGSYSKNPVQTQFGWHVILLEDSRPGTPPSFDEVKSQLRAIAENQRARGYISSLRTKAAIELK